MLALVSLIMYWLSMYMKYRFIIQAILASAHDIVDSLNSDEITGRFALSSPILQKHLNFP